MAEALSAYLRTQGSVDYRNCRISYYTYSMFDTPQKYKVNVNVFMQSPTQEIKRTLALNNSYDNESDAINYGVEQGKKCIDKSYEAGKIAVLDPKMEKNKAKNEKTLTASLSKEKPDLQKKK